MCLEGNPDSEINQDIAPLANEKVILKHRYSTFYKADLETVLHCLKAEDVVLSGIMTDMCCESTARRWLSRQLGPFPCRWHGQH